MRKTSRSPNAMMESLHLKKFVDTGSRQEAAAAEMTAAEEAMRGAKRAAFITSERTKLAAARADKANKLSQDKAVHAAILKHQVGGSATSSPRTQLKCSLLLLLLSTAPHHMCL